MTIQKRLQQLPFIAGLLLVLAAFGLLIAMPAEAAAGARRGLEVCAGMIIPALLPFLIFSRLLTALGVPQALAALTRPLLGRLGISPYAAAPLFLGLTGGYPVGAAGLGSLVRDGLLPRAEGERLLPWCNNTGPAFIVGAVGSAVFGSVRLGLGLYLCHILAALTLALTSIRRRPGGPLPPLPSAPPRSLARALPESVRDAALATLNICAFVVFFSVLATLLRSLGLLGGLALTISRCTGASPQWSLALCTGLLELGSGIGALRGLEASPGNLALAAFLLGFGGLSVHCQTLSVLSDTNMKCARHFVGRILHGALSALYAWLLFQVL